ALCALHITPAPASAAQLCRRIGERTKAALAESQSESAGVVERQPTHLVRSRPNVTNEELMNCRAPKIVAGLLLIASADFAIAQQDHFPQPTSLRLSERNLPPGYSWLEIIKRPTLEAFAAAFTKDVVLEASVLPRPITGAADVRSF